jgi:hypothetical protein
MRIKFLIAGLIVTIGLLLITGCAPQVRGYSAHSDGSFASSTNTRTITYHAYEGDTRARLQVDLTLEAGSVNWTLADPTGAVRWTTQFDKAGTYEAFQMFDSIPGDWRFEVTMTEAAGHFDAYWQASAPEAAPDSGA